MTTKKMPPVAKFIHYAFDADAKLISQEEYYKDIRYVTTSLNVTVRSPVRNNAAVAQRLREIATQLEKAEG